MSERQIQNLKPVLSIFLLTATLFTVAFFKMEIRRVGYSILKLSQQERQLRENYRLHSISLTQMTRPFRVQQLVQNRMAFRQAEKGQIIYMTEQGAIVH